MDMIDLLFQPESPWFNNSFVKQLHNEVHKRIAYAPKHYVSLPSEQHKRLVDIFNREYGYATRYPWSSKLLKSLSQFVYWSWVDLDLDVIAPSHKNGLRQLSNYVCSHITELTFLNACNSQQSENVSTNKGQELNTSAIETLLLVLSLSDIRSPLFMSFREDPIKGHLVLNILWCTRTLCLQVLPVLQVKKEYWEQKIKEGDNEGDNGWKWLISLTAAIQLVLTRYGWVESATWICPGWKELYETVIEIKYGSWEGDLPPHPNDPEWEFQPIGFPARRRVSPLASRLPCFPGLMHMVEC
ncbi:hypothetical protein AX16_010788 [Volvariella volvacea WC 439]|nr:hypothetical protein AX16_010788 [Volvariella volvacea WC 439]